MRSFYFKRVKTHKNVYIKKWGKKKSAMALKISTMVSSNINYMGHSHSRSKDVHQSFAWWRANHPRHFFLSFFLIFRFLFHCFFSAAITWSTYASDLRKGHGRCVCCSDVSNVYPKIGLSLAGTQNLSEHMVVLHLFRLQ